MTVGQWISKSVGQLIDSGKLFYEKNENKNSPQITRISTDYKNKKNQCNQCNLWINKTIGRINDRQF